jgi:septum formation protein
MPTLILASTSIYRQALLQRLQLPFHCLRPDVDETALPQETPLALAMRLAQAKAQTVAHQQAADTWVLGSDQVAEVEGQALGKPGEREAAIAQLLTMSGRVVQFHTALCLANAEGQCLLEIDRTEVHFRQLDRAEITRYVDAETPFDCAGSFKSEGLGISLFDAIVNRDPSALIGLPLIATARLLRQAGFQLP